MITNFKYLKDFIVEESLGLVYVTLGGRTSMKKFKSLRNSFPHCRIRTISDSYWLPCCKFPPGDVHRNAKIL